MASLSSDDDGEDRSHPLAQERPGVYVQVVAPRRRRDRRSAPQEAAAKSTSEAAPEGRVTIPEGRITVPEGRISAVGEVVSAGQGSAIGSILESALDAQPRGSQPRIDPRVESALEGDADRPSGEREVVSERPAGYTRRSENSNGRTDLVVVTLPPPPRVPSFVPPGLIQAPPEGQAEAEYLGPSVLDAPTSLRPRAEPPGRVSWGVLGLVIALSAIVASALLVALRAPSAPDPEDYVPTPVSPFRVEVTPHPRAAEPTPDAVPTAPARAIAAEPAPVTKPAERPSLGAPTRSIPPAVATSTSVAAPAAKPVQPRTPVAAPAAPTRAAAPVTAAPEAPAAASTPSPEQPSELPENPYAEE